MSTMLWLTCLWLGLFFLVGLFRGFWNALAALVAFLAAYFGSTLLAGPLARAIAEPLKSLPGGTGTAWWVCAAASFIVIGALGRWGIKRLGRTWPLPGSLDRISGGVLGAVYGAGIGVFVLWGASVLMQTTWLEGRVDDEQKRAFLGSGMLVFSQKTMGSLIAWQSTKAGMPEHTVKLSSTLAAKPAETLNSLRGAVQSPGFKDLMRNPQLKQWAAEGNIDEIAQDPAFEVFLSDPGVVELREFLHENGISVSREVMAAQTAELWGQAQNLQNQPELQNLLQDPEVQRFLKGEGGFNASLLMKAKQALGTFSGREPDIEPNVDSKK